MANQAHRPFGFRPVRANAPTTELKMAASETLARGDCVILTAGQVGIALAASAELCGVVAQDASGLAANDPVLVWADPDEVFYARAEDDASAITLGSEVDLIGATGAMEIYL